MVASNLWMALLGIGALFGLTLPVTACCGDKPPYPIEQWCCIDISDNSCGIGPSGHRHHWALKHWWLHHDGSTTEITCDTHGCGECSGNGYSECTNNYCP